jgi:hypothetical protein
VEDLARMELERGECLSPMCNKEARDLSLCIGDCLGWLDLFKPNPMTRGKVKTPNSKLGCLVSHRAIASAD